MMIIPTILLYNKAYIANRDVGVWRFIISVVCHIRSVACFKPPILKGYDIMGGHYQSNVTRDHSDRLALVGRSTLQEAAGKMSQRSEDSYQLLLDLSKKFDPSMIGDSDPRYHYGDLAIACRHLKHDPIIKKEMMDAEAFALIL